MDEGNILCQKEIALSGKETSVSLLNNAAEDGAELLASLLKEISENGAVPEGIVQSGEASYTGIITLQYTKTT